MNPPLRLAFGKNEIKWVKKCIDYYRKREIQYEGYFEKLYCEKFVEYMGGGYADAVATGTAAVYIALAALELEKGSEVLVSPVTDPGTISAIILNGYKPKLVDSRPDDFNVDWKQIEQRITQKVKAILVCHIAGNPINMVEVKAGARKYGLPVIEDCSQAHGATWEGIKVGNFGDLAVFSTMYRKAHITGSSGGVVFTKSEKMYWKARAYADRGKPFYAASFNERDPRNYLFPALNLNTDEISCAIGIASLERLEETIQKRREYVEEFKK